MKSKLKSRDPNDWVIAVDTRDKKLESCALFCQKGVFRSPPPAM
uniref:Uncharacterized protein n=1 Tax=Arundo donax TaxID=35708 RepID=A0A0A8ZPP1_ARUDO